MPNPRDSRRAESLRFLVALAVSLLLHAAVLGGGLLRGLLDAPPKRVIEVTLRVPAKEAPPAEPLVKNTLDAEAEKPVAEPQRPEPPPQARPAATPRPQRAEKKQVQAAQRKIARHTYYPPEAIARGLEGDVRLLIVLVDDGAIADVQVAASSGHAILDNAAVKAAYAMGRLPGVTAREMILPVSFRLQ